MLVCLITGDVDPNYLVKVMSARFIQSFPFVINNFEEGQILRICKYTVHTILYSIKFQETNHQFTLVLSQRAQKKKKKGFRSLKTWVPKNWVYGSLLAWSPSEYA